MTNTEADNLIATLPKPRGLTLFHEGDRIVMDGGKWGAHTLSAKVSSAERLLLHWRGYVENQGLTLGPGYTTAHPRSLEEAFRGAKALNPPGLKHAYIETWQDRG